jgi:predicted protein tyrosine phosphatase
MPRMKVLFLCAMNRRRSLTAEHLYRNDPRIEVRSAGLRTDARRRATESDLAWADVVFVMERAHLRRLREDFPDLDLPPVEVLDIPDDFEYMEPALQEVLRLTVEPDLVVRLNAMDAPGEQGGTPT